MLMNNKYMIVETLLKINNKLSEMSAIPRDFGAGDLLYSTEIHTIVAIDKNPGINLTELSSILGVSKSAGSKFVKKLLVKDYITKSKAVDNQKEVLFNLTKKGKIASKGHDEFAKIKFEKLYGVVDIHKQKLELISNFLEDVDEVLSKL